MNTKNKVIGATALTTLSAVAYYGLCDRAFKKVFCAKANNEDLLAQLDSEEKSEEMTWFASMPQDELWMTSKDGLNLRGIRIKNHPKSKNWVIFSHGHHSNLFDMLKEAIAFDKEGYNILLVDHRGCGMSDGKYTTLGYHESADLCLWIDLLTKDHPEIKIVLYGESMGATTCMLALEHLQDSNVHCVIADSGYTSVKDILAYVLKRSYKLPFLTIEPMFTQMIKSKLGYRMKDANSLKALKENMIPVMFIHGEKDEVVPFEMVFDLYYANCGVKELFTISDVGHCQGKTKSDYYQRVFRFIQRFI